MSQSLSKVIIHIVFSTKNRERFLGDPGMRRDLCAYMAVILRDNVDSPALLINGVELCERHNVAIDERYVWD